ncbi:MAG TPA: CheR family methyltransferase [Acetobacteraceae bacterium]|nr:CheR family methyltransferase [Acetobacteraceae bacterium]
MSVLQAALTCRCPRCGRGRLFRNLLEVRDRCEVCGLDLSEGKLAEARRGRYGAKSFRSDERAPLGIELDEYLAREPDGAYAVRPFLRERVEFVRGNLADPSSLKRIGEFDVVFCRNVLIYVEGEAIERFFASLASLVKVGGYLFLGHSDGLDGATSSFELARVGEILAYLRRS